MKGFRDQMTHLASARMLQLIASQSRVWEAFVNTSLHLQKPSLAVGAYRFLLKLVWCRGWKHCRSHRTLNSQRAQGLQALGAVSTAGWISPPSWMAVARGRTGESRNTWIHFFPLPQISTLVSLCLSSPSVNSSFENLFLQPHLEIAVRSHFIEILNVQKMMRFSDDAWAWGCGKHLRQAGYVSVTKFIFHVIRHGTTWAPSKPLLSSTARSHGTSWCFIPSPK